jgi:hypothetical protein
VYFKRLVSKVKQSEVNEMKRIIIASLMLAFVSWPALAGTAANISMSADIAAQLELTHTIWQDAVGGTEVTAMDFGALSNSEAFEPLVANKSFHALYSANTSGRQYSIKQTTVSLVDVPTSVTLPDGACVMTPHTNGGDVVVPAGATFDTTARSFVGSNLVLYASEAAGTGNSIYVNYAITDQGTEIIPYDHPGGSFTSEVQVTLTLV